MSGVFTYDPPELGVYQDRLDLRNGMQIMPVQVGVSGLEGGESFELLSHKGEEPIEKITVHGPDIPVGAFLLTLLKFSVAEDVEPAVAHHPGGL